MSELRELPTHTQLAVKRFTATRKESSVREGREPELPLERAWTSPIGYALRPSSDCPGNGLRWHGVRR